jgi:hypothetical protein
MFTPIAAGLPSAAALSSFLASGITHPFVMFFDTNERGFDIFGISIKKENHNIYRCYLCYVVFLCKTLNGFQRLSLIITNKGSIMVEECPVCKMKVELIKVEDYPDYKKRYYSCGDIVKSVSKGL